MEHRPAMRRRTTPRKIGPGRPTTRCGPRLDRVRRVRPDEGGTLPAAGARPGHGLRDEYGASGGRRNLRRRRLELGGRRARCRRLRSGSLAVRGLGARAPHGASNTPVEHYPGTRFRCRVESGDRRLDPPDGQDVDVGRRSLVRAGGAKYSMPSSWPGVEATAYAGVETVRVVCGGEQVEFARYHRGRRNVRYRHYLPQLASKPLAVRKWPRSCRRSASWCHRRWRLTPWSRVSAGRRLRLACSRRRVCRREGNCRIGLPLSRTLG